MGRDTGARADNVPPISRLLMWRREELCSGLKCTVVLLLLLALRGQARATSALGALSPRCLGIPLRAARVENEARLLPLRSSPFPLRAMRAPRFLLLLALIGAAAHAAPFGLVSLSWRPAPFSNGGAGCDGAAACTLAVTATVVRWARICSATQAHRSCICLGRAVQILRLPPASLSPPPPARRS